MNNNIVSNPKTEVASGIKLNEKDYLNALLSSLKEMTKNYAVSLTEASNETLYHSYKQMADEISQMQRDVFELMFCMGWYSLEACENNKITTKYNMLNQEYTNLNG